MGNWSRSHGQKKYTECSKCQNWVYDWQLRKQGGCCGKCGTLQQKQLELLKQLRDCFPANAQIILAMQADLAEPPEPPPKSPWCWRLPTATRSRAAGAGGSTSALPTDAAGAGGRAGWCVNQGPRGNMEDAVDVISQLDVAEPTEFYAVYDGHGGTEAVTFVKRRLPQAVCRGRDALGDARQIGEALRE
ncbi:unnamed protein product, partial [Prorocentrum cordatum]